MAVDMLVDEHAHTPSSIYCIYSPTLFNVIEDKLTDRFPAWRTRQGRRALDPTWTLMSVGVNGSKYGPVYKPPIKRLAVREDRPLSLVSSSCWEADLTAIWIAPSGPIAELPNTFPGSKKDMVVIRLYYAVYADGLQHIYRLTLFYRL